MLKQKVFFFAAPGEVSDRMLRPEDLMQMAVNYVGLYGEGCLTDPETPSFVRRMLGQGSQANMPKAG